MEQDEIVQDSEALEILGSTENQEKKKKREALFELALFFVLGLLIGITLKSEAIKKITIGYNDYQLKRTSQSYDVDLMKKKLTDEMNKQQAAAEAQAQDQQAQNNPDAQVQAQTEGAQQTNQ